MPVCAQAQWGREGRPPWPHGDKKTPTARILGSIAAGKLIERETACLVGFGGREASASRLRNSHGGARRQDMTALVPFWAGPKRSVWHVAACGTHRVHAPSNHNCSLLLSTLLLFVWLLICCLHSAVLHGGLDIGSPSLLLLLSSVVFSASPPRLQTQRQPFYHQIILSPYFLTFKCAIASKPVVRLFCLVQNCMHRVCHPRLCDISSC